MKSELNGVVLMGGQSKRMGTDKAFLAYREKFLFEIAHEKLASFCERVFLSVNEEQFARLAGSYLLIQDKYPEEGPMTGLLSAFEQVGTSLLVLPVDVPLISTSTLRLLCDQRNLHQPATLWYDEASSRWEPLIGIWEYSAFPTLKQFFDKGGRSFQLFLQQNPPHKLNIQDLGEFKNVNKPSSFDELA